MVNLKVNNKPITVEEGSTVLRACQEAGVEVPVFCYHEGLSIAGNCRMCLVEIKDSQKPIASCAMPVHEDMEVLTNTPAIQESRKGNLEFLLINHPLDCPICDEAGECDLQDITMAYGPSLGRFKENKRVVQDKNFGPLIKTSMNRCIQCTRCVRFAQEVAGVPEVVAVGRGEHMEITTYLNAAVSSELSGNLVDICPVGALTSKPYAFKARSWELKHTNSIDVLDAIGSHIRIDTRDGQIMRILPRTCDRINETWISDKARHAFDGLTLQRLDRPYVRQNGHLVQATWEEALSLVAEKLTVTPPNQVAALAGDLADVESIFLLKELFHSLGIHNLDCRQDGAYLPHVHRRDYLFNTTIQEVETADACLIIGSNLRLEAPLVNTRLRKAHAKGMQIGYLGPKVNLTYPYTYLGDRANILNQLWRGKHPFLKVLQEAKNPMIILGQGALQSEEGERIYHLARALAQRENVIRPDWNGFNVLHTAAGRVGGMDVGFLPKDGALGTKQVLNNDDIKVVYLLNADEVDTKALGKAFVIYQGHHGDAGASRADVILPGAAYTEKTATYTNMEGRAQQTKMVTEPLGDAKEDWKIIRKLSEYAKKPLAYNTHEQIMQALAHVHTAYGHLGEIAPAPWEEASASNPKEISVGDFALPIQTYYMTDPISRASQVMAQCRKEILQQGAR
jgi:NADH-quinone oxidoreductase subunit G